MITQEIENHLKMLLFLCIIQKYFYYFDLGDMKRIWGKKGDTPSGGGGAGARWEQTPPQNNNQRWDIQVRTIYSSYAIIL